MSCEGVNRVLCAGASAGYSELALAVEFPGIHFHITDLVPTTRHAEKLAKKWRLKNVSFGRWDVRTPFEGGSFDLAASVEVLEHIEDDALAAHNLRDAASRYVFSLVPFADAASQSDGALREQERRLHEHFRPGYSEEDLRRLFPGTMEVRGCYWRDAGGAWRTRMDAMDDFEILERRQELIETAQTDVRRAVPQSRAEAFGIWALARA
jgi:hypothetical protein